MKMSIPLKNQTKDLIREMTDMRRQVTGLKRSAIRHMQAEAEIRKLRSELRERTKELNCIYGISNIREKLNSLEKIIQGIIDIIPASWQYPEITCARAIVERKEFKTSGFAETAYKQSSDIHAYGNKIGVLEVYYTKARPERDEGPFLKAERDLLNVIAERLGKIIERKKTEEELANAHVNLRKLLEHLQKVREEERMRISYDIHDDLGQSLTALQIDLKWLIKRLPKTSKPLAGKTYSMLKLVDMMIQNVRRLAAELRPPLLDDFGLSASMHYYVEKFQKQSGIRCKVIINPSNIAFDKAYSLVIFRIFQELMTNILRHANATKVKIKLAKMKDKLVLCVADNGKGIAEKQISDYKSFGLQGIQHRVHSLGGRFEIRGIPDKGTTAVIRFPLKRQDNEI